MLTMASFLCSLGAFRGNNDKENTPVTAAMTVAKNSSVLLPEQGAGATKTIGRVNKTDADNKSEFTTDVEINNKFAAVAKRRKNQQQSSLSSEEDSDDNFVMRACH